MSTFEVIRRAHKRLAREDSQSQPKPSLGRVVYFGAAGHAFEETTTTPPIDRCHLGVCVCAFAMGQRPMATQAVRHGLGRLGAIRSLAHLCTIAIGVVVATVAARLRLRLQMSLRAEAVETSHMELAAERAQLTRESNLTVKFGCGFAATKGVCVGSSELSLVVADATTRVAQLHPSSAVCRTWTQMEAIKRTSEDEDNADECVGGKVDVTKE